MALDFNSVLANTPESLERAKLPPKGVYVMQITKVPDQGKAEKDGRKWDTINFQLQGVRPTESVDADSLREYGEPKNIMTRHSFMFEEGDNAAIEKANERLQRFIYEHVGIPWGTNMKQALNQCAGKQILVELDYRPDKNDPDNLYLNIKSTAPLE